MSIATVVTRGYGSFGTIANVVTSGYTIGEEAAAPVLMMHRLSFNSQPSQVIGFSSASYLVVFDDIGAPGLFANILLESGSSLLLEDDGKVKREIL